MLPPPYHPGAASFSAYGPVQIAAAPPMGPRQFYPPPIFYWPYPSPPVSPTSYYAPALPPPPGALPAAAAAQPQQAMVSTNYLPTYFKETHKHYNSTHNKLYFLLPGNDY